MYEGDVSTVRTIIGDRREFPITVGLYQVVALSLYLLTLVMDELTNKIQD